MDSKPLSVTYDDMSEYLKDKERHMKQELKDYVIERLITIRRREPLDFAADCYSRGRSSGVIERVDELLLLLVEVADDESQ